MSCTNATIHKPKKLEQVKLKMDATALNTLNKSTEIEQVLESARIRYRTATPRSLTRHLQARTVMPGGNTRSILHYDPYPVTVSRGEGCKLWDLDENRYTDFLGEYSAGLFGHSNPLIKQAILDVMHEGIVLCAPNQYEVELADLICDRFASCDQVRFCNSGTEANLLAISAAIQYTGRNKVLVFRGAYHGSVFYFGKHPSRINAPFEFITGEYNDAESLAELVQANQHDLAAILVEPMQGSGGCIPGTPEFLTALRQVSEHSGAILIFDEVMTSRLSPGGMQEAVGVIPDMTTFGKYMGGGMTFGSFGGRQDIMAQFDPNRPDPLVHPGTFNNNVLTMAAGLVGLRDIYSPDVARAHNSRGERFKKDMTRLVQQKNLPMQISGLGSLLCIHFCSNHVVSINDIDNVDFRLRTLFHLEMLLAGIYMAQRGFMSLSLAIEEDDYAHYETAFGNFLNKYENLIQAYSA